MHKVTSKTMFYKAIGPTKPETRAQLELDRWVSSLVVWVNGCKKTIQHLFIETKYC